MTKSKPKTDYDTARTATQNRDVLRMHHWTPEAGLLSPHCYSAQLEVLPRNHAPYLIGLEIELEDLDNRDPNRSRLMTYVNIMFPKQAVCVYDGSLTRGIEVLPAPMTITEYKQNRSKYWQFLSTVSNKFHYSAHDSGNCGLHIHISKKALYPQQWDKLNHFLCSNQAGFFRKISRRERTESSHYAHHSDPFYFCKFNTTYSKYRALNLTRNNTAEFRFFRGTLKPSSFFFSIESCLLLVEYVKSLPENKRLNMRGFLKFAKNSTFQGTAAFLQSTYTAMQPAERQRVSALDREQRRIERQNIRRQAEQALLDEVERYHQTALRRLPIAGRCTNQEILSDSALRTIRIIPVPVHLDGFWPQRLRRAMEEHLTHMNIPVMGTISPSAISLTRTRGGWGRPARFYPQYVYHN